MEKVERCKVLLSLPKEVRDDFSKIYPRLTTVFLRRCMMKAISSREFFEDVFFGVRDKYSMLGMNRPEYLVNDD